jgi:hypothetical protein
MNDSALLQAADENERRKAYPKPKPVPYRPTCRSCGATAVRMVAGIRPYQCGQCFDGMRPEGRGTE